MTHHDEPTRAARIAALETAIAVYEASAGASAAEAELLATLRALLAKLKGDDHAVATVSAPGC